MSRRKEIYLIGAVKHSITGTKLPSIGDVLRVLFYNLRYRRLDLSASSVLVADEVILFWKKARIPTQNPDKIRAKIKTLYESWRGLQKSEVRAGEIYRKREAEYVGSFEDLFDVAAQNALQTIKIEEDKQFLLSQRKKGRPGCMIGVDKKLASLEARKKIRQEKEKERKERAMKNLIDDSLAADSVGK